jgi:RNA polymerase sigma factor (sigma-70 family)
MLIKGSEKNLMNDEQLLARHVRENDQSAFAEIVRRRYGMVYGVALRKTGNAQLAEDVAQTVFLILATRAKTIGAKTIVSGWLFKTADFTARNTLRHEVRRKYYEAKALQESLAKQEGGDMNRSRNESLLDDALVQLTDQERDAVLLRYLQGMSIEETSEALGVSYEAAHKRASRGIERMRKYFAKSGIVLTAAAATALIAENLAHAAPESAVESAVSISMASASLSNAHIQILYQGVLKQMAILKLKIIAGCALGAIAIGGGATLAVHSQIPARPITDAQAQAVLADCTARFKQVGGNMDVTLKSAPASQDAAPLYLKWNAELKANKLPGEISPLLNEALAKPKCTWHDNYVPNDVPLGQAIRAASRSLREQADVLVRSGGWDEAAGIELRSFATVKHTRQRGDVIGELVAIACEALTLDEIDKILQAGGQEPGVADRVAAQMQANPIDWRVDNAYLNGERRCWWNVLEDYRKNKVFPKDGVIDNLNAISFPMRNRMISLVESEYLDEAIELNSISNQPYSELVKSIASYHHDTPGYRWLVKELGKDAAGGDLPISGNQLNPNYFIVVYKTKAHEQMTLAAASVLSVKAKTGQFPASIPIAITDPWNGKPFVYERSAAGFTISSAGAEESLKGSDIDVRKQVAKTRFEYRGK